MAECAELGGIAKPSAFVFFGDRSGIEYPFVFHAGETRLGEKRGPFGGGDEVGGDGQDFAPLMRMHVFAVIIDEDPGHATVAQDAVNFAQSSARIGPIVGRFDGNRVCEEMGIPGNLFGLADDEHGVFQAEVVAAGASNHLVGNIEADDAPFGHLLGKQTNQPAGATAHVEDVIFGTEAHAVEHRKHDREVILLHALAAARFRPAVKFLTKRFGMNWGIRGCFHPLKMIVYCRDCV